MINPTIEEILVDAQFSEYCKYISNNSSMWEDLYQDFRIKVLTQWKKVEQALDKRSYCRSIIHNEWRTGTGYGNQVKNSMSYVNYADRGLDITDRILIAEPSNELPDITTELNVLLNSPDKKIKNQAKIFEKCMKGKTRAELSREESINYRTVHDAVRETGENIKTIMTKNEIKSRLLAEGISASYSGKKKTFYTNKKPSEDLQTTIVKAGFKAQDKK